MKVTEVIPCSILVPGSLPFYESKVQAGFPSPADDYMRGKLDGSVANKNLR